MLWFLKRKSVYYREWLPDNPFGIALKRSHDFGEESSPFTVQFGSEIWYIYFYSWHKPNVSREFHAKKHCHTANKLTFWRGICRSSLFQTFFSSFCRLTSFYFSLLKWTQKLAHMPAYWQTAVTEQNFIFVRIINRSWSCPTLRPQWSAGLWSCDNHRWLRLRVVGTVPGQDFQTMH